MAEAVKIRAICIDTLTGIQNEVYMQDTKKPNHDAWKDYGVGLWKLISVLQDRGFELILILGEPGTGKSTMMRTLEHDTCIWINADNKNPVWKGGKEEFGTKNNPRLPYHFVPKTYEDIINHIDKVQERIGFEERRFAFLTGHIEDYQTGNEKKKRMKVLGKLSTKMQLEGRLETVLYSEVRNEGGKAEYILTTQNDGMNTARSPMDLFPSEIANDGLYIINTLLEY